MKDTSYKTAIKRTDASAPLKYLLSQNKISDTQMILDYGCGRGKDVEVLAQNGYSVGGYDPHWKNDKDLLNYKYDVVLCTYVLNVVGPKIRKQIISELKNLTFPGGKIYITVRRDIAKLNTGRTTQYFVKLPYKVIKETHGFCIYEL